MPITCLVVVLRGYYFGISMQYLNVTQFGWLELNTTKYKKPIIAKE